MLINNSFTTDTTFWAVIGDGVYVDNPEFVYIKKDGNGNILFGIKYDGNFYFGAGCPQQIKDYVRANQTELIQLFNGKVDKEPNKSLISKTFADNVSYIDNPEWIELKTDAEGRILEGRKVNGEKYIYGLQYDTGNKQVILVDEETDITDAFKKCVRRGGVISIEGSGIAVVTSSVLISRDDTHIIVSDSVTMKLADNVYAPMIVTPGSPYYWDSPNVDANHLYNISIKGGTWDFNYDGNPPSGLPSGWSMSDYVGISIVDVSYFQLSDCKLLGATKFSFLGANITYGYFNNIELDTSHENQDGLHFDGPVNYTVIENIFGRTGKDDFIGLNCGGDFWSPQKNIKRKGNARHIIIRNIMTNSNIRLLNGNEHVMDDVTLDGICGRIWLSCYGEDAVYGKINITNCQYLGDQWFVGNSTTCIYAGGNAARKTTIECLTIDNVQVSNRDPLKLDSCEIKFLIINGLVVNHEPVPSQPYDQVTVGSIIYTRNTSKLIPSVIHNAIISNSMVNDMSEYQDKNGNNYPKYQYLISTDEIDRLIVTSSILGVTDICDTSIVVPQTSCVELI